MYLQNTQLPQAQLVISTKTLDFGILTRDTPTEGHGMATLIIVNEGEKILVGRIALQVAWISVYPPDFRINPGESSEHSFTIRQNAETSWTTHKLGSDFIALINSNGGSETIGGFYYSDPSKKTTKKNPVRAWILYLLPLAIVLTGVLIYWLSASDKEAKRKQQEIAINALYTQAAETYMANASAILPSSTMSVPDETTVEMPVISITTTSPVPEMTFTPWVAADYPNVEEFIRSYYASLQEGSYENAWWMLSEKMQIACCYEGGSLPYDIYTAYWTTVDYVEVVYAYLQAYDTNPAEVNVDLIYHNKDGTTAETISKFFIISDAVRNTLLIDEVK
ncbi:MAG: hypothetical protein AB9907_16765 [Flexilinea sp.]